MPAHSQSFQPRPGGGFNAGFGNFSDEHLDENALQQASAQKVLGQQQAAGAGSPSGVPTGGQHPLVPGSPPPPPREVGGIAEELVVRPVADVVQGLMSLFDFSAALGISPPESKSPEEKARLQQLHQRFQKLNAEDQQQVQKSYQRDLQKKKAEEQQKQEREARRRQQEASSIDMPSSPKKGPVGPSGSSKQRASTKLEQDRKTLGGPASAN